jgi:hypothetical protein
MKSKISAKGYDLLFEQYPDEWKELVFNRELEAMLNALASKSRSEALAGKSYPCAEIVFHDSIGVAHSDPTISDPKLLMTRRYKDFNEPIEKNEKEVTYLYMSFVTKDPYLIRVPAGYLSQEEIGKK